MGKTYVDPAIAGKVLGQLSSHQTQPATMITNKLTDRELEILRLIAQGLTNLDISKRLFLSEGTVRNHVSAILAKLGVPDRTQAAVIAIRHGLK
jgi:DNA-binding NarL/FixJ family response regulator